MFTLNQSYSFYSVVKATRFCVLRCSEILQEPYFSTKLNNGKDNRSIS